MRSIQTYPIFIILLLLTVVSCGNERFSSVKNTDNPAVPTVQTSQKTLTSRFSTIKPEVDFLFLWDNSTSTNFIDANTLNALSRLLANISNQFDYHVMIAPLRANSSSQERISTYTPYGLSGNALTMQTPLSSIPSSALGFTKVSGNQEAGVTRAIDVINSNRSNGVFRQNAYLNIVVISNEDDTSYIQGNDNGYDRGIYINEKLNELLCLRGHYTPPSGSSCIGITSLNSQQMRFMSIVAYRDQATESCGQLLNWRKNRVYKEISSRIYSAPYSNAVVLTDQNSRSDLETSSGFYNFDSYDICQQSSFSNLFDGINASIQATLIPHKYNYAPVASSGANIDPNQVRVYKNGSELTRLSFPVSPTDNGFTFTNSVQTVNTRYEPTPGEPFTGYVVQLHGSARAVWPDSVRATTRTPVEYFGYISLSAKPFEPSISVKINGVNIPKSSTNGWQLVKDTNGQPQFFSSKNIKIQSNAAKCPSASDPNLYCQSTPALNRTGYMIQLFGNAIYGNGADVVVTYDPSS